MDYRSELLEDRGFTAARKVRTTLAYSILLFGVAASLAAVPAAIWLIVSRGLQ